MSVLFFLSFILLFHEYLQLYLIIKSGNLFKTQLEPSKYVRAFDAIFYTLNNFFFLT